MLIIMPWIFTLILSVFLLVICILWLFTLVLFRKRLAGEPPIVKGNILLGSASDFSRHAVEFLHKTERRYGNVFTLRLVNQYLTIIMDPHSYETFSREKNFDFDAIQKQVNKNVFSYVLIEPKKILSITTKAAKGEIMLDALEKFAENLNISCDRICFDAFPDQPRASTSSEIKFQGSDGLRNFVSRTIFDAIFNTIYGHDRENTHASSTVFKNFEIFHKYFNYLWLGFPIGLFPKAARAQKSMLCMPSSSELLARSDLSLYLRNALEFMLQHDQSEMDIKSHNLVNLHVNYNTFRLAFWTLYHVLQDDVAYAELNNEIKGVVEHSLDEGCCSSSPTVKDLEGMKVLDSIVQESCRMSSGVFMVRFIKRDANFTTASGETFVMRKGDRIALYPPAMHNDPEIFTDPLKFKYDRFIDAKFFKAGKELKHPVMGFGALCPGKRYALLQLKWFILTILTRFDIRLRSGQRAVYDTSYYGHEILPPVADVQIDFTARNNSPLLRLSH